MTPQASDDDLDVVRGNFIEECPQPTAADVDRWSRRYPQHADALLDCAIVLITTPYYPVAEPTPEEEEAAWQRHLARMREIKREDRERELAKARRRRAGDRGGPGR